MTTQAELERLCAKQQQNSNEENEMELKKTKIKLKIGKGMPKKENPKPATEKEIRAQKSPKTIISGAVSPELLAKFDKIAAKQKVTRSTLLRTVIENFCKKGK